MYDISTKVDMYVDMSTKVDMYKSRHVHFYKSRNVRHFYKSRKIKIAKCHSRKQAVESQRGESLLHVTEDRTSWSSGIWTKL